jgi:hypothetical protein
MGFNWAEKFSEGRRIRQRVPVLGYRVPLFPNLQVKIKRFRLALRIIVVCLNPLCGNAPTGLVICCIPMYRYIYRISLVTIGLGNNISLPFTKLFKRT